MTRTLITGVVVVTKKVGKYINNRLLVSSPLTFLFHSVNSYPSECLVWMESSPGQKYYKFHEPDSYEITGNLHHFLV